MESGTSKVRPACHALLLAFVLVCTGLGCGRVGYQALLVNEDGATAQDDLDASLGLDATRNPDAELDGGGLADADASADAQGTTDAGDIDGGSIDAAIGDTGIGTGADLLWSYTGNVTSAEMDAFNLAVNNDPNDLGFFDALRLNDGWFRLGVAGHRCAIEPDLRIECVLPQSQASRFSVLEVNMGARPSAGWLAQDRSALVGRRYRYEAEVWLEPDFFSLGMEGRFLQFSQIPDVSDAASGRPTVVQLRIKDGSWRLRVDGDPRPTLSNYGNLERSEEFDLGAVTELGQWTRWTIDVVWAFDDQGSLTVTRNRETVHVDTAAPNCFHDGGGVLGPTFSLGVRVLDDTATTATEVRYGFRNVRIYEIGAP